MPAHEEQESIESCLGSLARAGRHPALDGVEVRYVLVLDSCRDTTGDRASEVRRPWRRQLSVVETAARNVGAARRAGFAAALSLSDGLAHERCWLATTDADSRVPHDWLARQLAWRRRGASALAGTVRVSDWSPQPSGVRRRYEEHLRRRGLSSGHGHVHGANLSFSAAAYRRAGGLPPLATAEDHAMWRALGSSGARLVSPGDLVVETSARREGRAPAGFASLLGSLGGGRA